MNKSVLDDEVRYRIFKLVEDNPTLSQRELAKEIGISLGKLNYCLNSLVDIGLIKVGNFKRSKHKFGYVYLLTPKGVIEKAKVTARFLAAKEAEYEALSWEIEVLRKENDLSTKADKK